MSNKKKLKLQIKLLDPEAKIPTNTKYGDAGYDLYANKNITINTGSVGKVPTGIAMKLPDGYWGKVFDRSGIFTNVMAATGAGVIDNGYRGEIIVCMLNPTTMPIRIIKGEKFAQITLHELIKADIEVVDDLEESERGDKGFGSSDKES